MKSRHRQDLDGARIVAREYLRTSGIFSPDFKGWRGSIKYALDAFWAGDHKGGDLNAEMLLSKARDGDPEIWTDCVEASAKAIEDGKPLPPSLAAFVAEILLTSKPTGKRGVKSGQNQFRDAAIAVAIDAVAQVPGIDHTRSAATRDKGGPASACSIVAEILPEFGVNLAEDTVQEIWKVYKDTSAFQAHMKHTRRRRG